MNSPFTGIVQTLLEKFRTHRSARNVIWNMLGGFWAGVLSVLATPWYVARLGLAGYGIIGLWLMMQVMLGLLDMGMGASLVREFANARSGLNRLEYRRDLLRSLEVVYGATALLFCLVLGILAGAIVHHWLKVPAALGENLPQTIRLMGMTLALQFVCILYVNGLSGIQEHGQMNAVQMFGNTLRYGGGVAVLFWRAELEAFFLAQVIVAAVQMMALRSILWKKISKGASRPPTFNFSILKRMGRFSAGMAATAVFSVLLCNIDRIMISRMLPASELGKYALAFTATGLLQMAIQPFYRSFFPRYAELISIGNENQLLEEYFYSCQFLSIVILALSVVAWCFAPELFAIWLNHVDDSIIKIFRWLIFGITCAGLMWLPAALQQAQGRPGLHVGMIIGALLLGLPVMVWAINRYGVVGGTAVWVLHGVSGLTLELWLMHRRMLVGYLGAWYRKVILVPAIIIFPLVIGSAWFMPKDLGSITSLLWIGITGSAVSLAALFGTGVIRSTLAFSKLHSGGE
jgi:O-antigen/teichoic acid export membrane protein